VSAYRIYELHAPRPVLRPARVLIRENDTVIRMVEPPVDGYDVEIMGCASGLPSDEPATSSNLGGSSEQQPFHDHAANLVLDVPPNADLAPHGVRLRTSRDEGRPVPRLLLRLLPCRSKSAIGQIRHSSV
jgi:hypothetical protein